MYYVYIMTNKYKNVLYTGITGNLKRRVYEHKNKLIDGFTKRYNIQILVYFEEHTNVNDAILREKAIKNLVRTKKHELINSINPNWSDLFEMVE